MTRLAAVRGRVVGADRLSVGLLVLAVLPVVAAVVRMLLQHRVPLGDNGLIALRSFDVLTSHHPWFGTWTSASLSAGLDFNNPSPLQFDLLALFVKPFGVSRGAIIGAGCINAAAIVVAIRQGRRAAGRRGELVFAVCAAGLAWTLGSEMLVDVWQPHNLVLPFLAVLACCAAVAAGEWGSLPWAVGVGSVVVGTHLSFVYVTLLVLAASVAWSLVWSPPRGDLRQGALRATWVSVGVAVVCWLQPFVEQVAGRGEGNLARLARASGATDELIGFRLGARLVAQVVAIPPWWLRPSFADSIRFTGYSSDGGLRPAGVVRLAVAAPAVTVVAALLVVAIVAARRRSDRPASGVLVAALAGLVGVVLTAGVMPAGVIGLAPHQMRWIWPVSALVTVAMAWQLHTLTSRWRPVGRARRSSTWILAAVAMVAGFSVAAVPSYDSDLGPAVTRSSNDAIRSLMRQLAAIDLPGPTTFDGSTLAFAEPYSGPVLAALVESGEPIRAGTESFARQLGDGRRPRGDERWSLQIRDGERTDVVSEGETLLASAANPQGGIVAVVLIEQSAD